MPKAGESVMKYISRYDAVPLTRHFHLSGTKYNLFGFVAGVTSIFRTVVRQDPNSRVT